MIQEVLSKENMFVLVEDTPTTAKNVIDDVKCFHVTFKTTILENLEEVKELLKDEGYNYFFLVDINLGGENPDGGINVIEFVNEQHPGALIMAYSNSFDEEIIDRAFNAGASDFLEKGPEWEKEMKRLHHQVKRYFTKSLPSITPTAQYFCQVLEVLEDRVLLHLENAQDREQQTERYFDIKRFNGIGISKLSKDLPVLLSLYESFDTDGNSTTTTIFKEGDASFFPVSEPLPEIDFNYLQNRKVKVFEPKRRNTPT